MSEQDKIDLKALEAERKQINAGIKALPRGVNELKRLIKALPDQKPPIKARADAQAIVDKLEASPLYDANVTNPYDRADLEQDLIDKDALERELSNISNLDVNDLDENLVREHKKVDDELEQSIKPDEPEAEEEEEEEEPEAEEAEEEEIQKKKKTTKAQKEAKTYKNMAKLARNKLKRRPHRLTGGELMNELDDLLVPKKDTGVIADDTAKIKVKGKKKLEAKLVPSDNEDEEAELQNIPSRQGTPDLMLKTAADVGAEPVGMGFKFKPKYERYYYYYYYFFY